MDNSQYLFRIRTVKAAPFRTLVEAIKDILTDANIEIDSTGIKIMSMDGTHSILVHLRLQADRFDEFHCPQKHIIGVNMINFFKLVKTMSNSESIVLFMKKSDTTKLGIEILNGEKQMAVALKLVGIKVGGKKAKQAKATEADDETGKDPETGAEAGTEPGAE
jgi:proliferating cell nuclear antigen